MIGCTLQEVAGNLSNICHPSSNCTHLLDLVNLTANHVLSGSSSIQYDIAVADEIGDVIVAEVRCNGIKTHQWSITNHKIISPSAIADNTMMKGFYGWASTAFAKNTFLAATAMQRGYFVAQARRYDLDNSSSRRPSDQPNRMNTCHSYNQAIIQDARPIGNITRDFTHSREKLLKFE